MNLVYTSKIVDSKPQVNLTGSKFQMGFGISNAEAGAVLDLPYLNYTLELIQWIGVGTFIKVPIPLKSCVYEDFPSISDDILQLNLVSSYLCPDLTNFNNFTISGLITDDWYQYLELNVKLQESAIVNLTQIKREIDAAPWVMQVLFTDTGLNYDNIAKPLPKMLNSYYTSVGLSYVKFSEILISTLEFSTDENYFLFNPTTTQDSMFDRTIEYSQSIEDRRDPNYQYQMNLMTIKITASPKYFIINRTYQKLPDFLASMSGLLSNFLVILFICGEFINHSSARKKLLSKVIKYEGKKNFDVKFLKHTFSEPIKPIHNEMEAPSFVNRNFLIHENEQLHMINIERRNSQTCVKANFENRLDNELKLPIIEICRFSTNRESRSIKPKPENELEHAQEDAKLSNEGLNIGHIRKNSASSNHTVSSQLVKKEKNQKLLNIKNLNSLLSKCCFRKAKKEHKILKSAEEKVFFYLDVTTYIKKMQEFDLLKYILLTTDQRSLFSFLAKPLISTNDISSSVYKEYEQEQIRSHTLTADEISLLHQGYIKLQSQSFQSDQDKKLIELVNAEVENIKQF